MNIKTLREKKNELLLQAETLVNEAEKETRSLSDTEYDSFTKLTNKIKEIDVEIRKYESLRSDGEKIEVRDNMEVEKMKSKEKELRGLEQYLRKQDGEEVRALVTTSEGGAVIPEHIEGTIVKKMEETSPVFAMSRKFPSVSGTLKIAKENEVSMAGFVGEGQDVAEQELNLGEVKLTQKRVGAAISLSNQLINDSAVNIVDYSIDLLSRKVAKAIEKSILVGTGDDEFAGIVNEASVKSIKIKKADPVTVDVLMDMYNLLHPEFLAGACFIFSRPFFNILAKLKDNNGHFYMQNGMVNGKLTYTLFGVEVIVTDVLTEDTPAVFGSIGDAYATLIKTGLSLQHVVGDTTQALRGSQLLVLDGYMDGVVFNDQAVVKLDTTLV